ncbi:alpha/beta hydrolase family protein [Pedobacter sp. AW31-3R]|uniref:alpha/beta hydrolase family protein n=1 Tax=Pedobacter sp. AW31-3R TaxID=3445781 RepID=UPI003FA0C2A5
MKYSFLILSALFCCTAANAQQQSSKTKLPAKKPVVATAQQQKYTETTVSFKSQDDTITFAGALTLPKGKTNIPAVVIVSGSYKQDRDGMMAGHPLFKDIADYLSSNGIAVLRLDDRGTGKTTGVYETATTADFGDDALKAIQYLKGIKEINPFKIGLLGHSEGGAASAIAAAKSKDVAFIVSVAGLATSGYNSLIQQNEDLVNNSQLTEVDKKRSNEINGMMFKIAFKYADSDSLENKLNTTYNDWKVKDDAYFKTLNIEFDHFRFPIYSYVNYAIGPWYRYFVKFDAAKTIGQVKVPILALNGDKDLMVSGQSNLDNWKNYAAAGGNNKVETHLLPGLNHLFLPCVTCTPQEYSTIKAGFSPEALSLIRNWIQQHTK